jgi:hypothetical protein
MIKRYNISHNFSPICGVTVVQSVGWVLLKVSQQVNSIATTIMLRWCWWIGCAGPTTDI